MGSQIFRIRHENEYRKAGPTDLIQLAPAPGANPVFVMRRLLDVLVYGIANGEFIHLSGPTGSAKSSLLDALHLVPDNFRIVCAGLEQKPLPLRLYPIEMATYDTPGELYSRRALKDGTTYDEKSALVTALEQAEACAGKSYNLIWLREMGRVHSAGVQGGLLNLMTKGSIVLPGGRRLAGSGISWVADSNYQAEQDCTHTLVTLDDALKRRFSINLTLDYLSITQEIQVLQYLIQEGYQCATRQAS
jgi:hypothetical protein